MRVEYPKTFQEAALIAINNAKILNLRYRYECTDNGEFFQVVVDNRPYDVFSFQNNSMDSLLNINEMLIKLHTKFKEKPSHDGSN